MKRWKSILVCCLCFFLGWSAAGCGRAGGEAVGTSDSNDELPAEEAYVYVAEYHGLDGVDSLSNAVLGQDQMYYLIQDNNSTAQMVTESVCVMDLATLESKEILFREAAVESIHTMAVAPGGELWGIVVRSEERTDNDQVPSLQYVLLKWDSNGQEMVRQELTAMLTADSQASSRLYPQKMYVDADDNVYLLLTGMRTKLLVLDAQGQTVFEVSDMDWAHDLCQSSDGAVFAYGYDYSGTGGYVLRQIGIQSKELSDAMHGLPQDFCDIFSVTGEANALLLNSGSRLYRYDLSTQTSEEILSWIDNDINGNTVQQITYADDGRILAFLYNDNGIPSSVEAVYLTETLAAEMPQKTTLTYAAMHLPSDVQRQIVQFNRTNPSYRIEVREYSASDAGTAQLNTAIISGNAPDIVDLSYIDVSIYSSKGILTDLYPLIDADASVSREDFIPNILKLYEANGKLHGISLAFQIESIMGRSADVGSEIGWTMAEMRQLMEAQPEGTLLLQHATKYLMLMIMTRMCANDYIDWDKGTCSFDSAEFIELLEFTGQFPDDVVGEYRTESEYVLLAEGKTLLREVNIDNVQDYLANAAMFGEAVTCIGYPTVDGIGGAIAVPYMSIGITESCQHKEAAWQFIRSMLEREFQEQLHFLFSVREDVLQAQMDAALNGEVKGSYSLNGFDYQIQPATAGEIAALRQLIDSAQYMSSLNDEIYHIITEETGAYYAGHKTVEEVAEIIQSRAEIYVSENQ